MAVLIVCLAACTGRVAQRLVPPEQRLLVAELSLTGATDKALSSLFDGEQRRLAEVCPTASPDCGKCVARSRRPIRVKVATLLQEPRSGSAPVGIVYLALRPVGEEESDLVARLEVETTAAPAAVPWVDDLGDWSYGIQIDGDLRVDGEWAQPLRLPVAGWLPLHSAGLDIFTDTIQGQILELDGVVASGPAGQAAAIPSGAYLIERVTPSGVEFRRETAADFGCLEDVEQENPLPPSIHASAAAFFTAENVPRFRTKYTKGC